MKVSVDEALCTALFAIRAALREGTFHSLETYSHKFCTVLLTMRDKTSQQAAAASRFFFEKLQRKISVLSSTAVVTVKN